MKLAAIIVIAACKRTPDPSPAPAPEPPAGDELSEKMRHCPVTVPEVTTELADSDGGVRFELRATGDALAEARRRAHALADFSDGRSSGKHGGGRGGGLMRNCPIVAKDTRITAEDVDGGVRVTVVPIDPAKLGELRTSARARLERAPVTRANVVREERAAGGETRLYSGGIADLDGDGTLELVAGGFSAGEHGHHPTVLVYRQHGDEWLPLAEAGWDGGAGSTIRNVAIADVDGDGKLDIVAVGKIGASGKSAKARIAVFGLEAGKLVKRAETDWLDGQYTHGYGLAIGDLDGDGKPEIVSSGFQFDGTVETGYVRVWSYARGAFTLRAQTTLAGQGEASMRVNDIAIGDVDGDGKPEIVVAGRHSALKTDDTAEHLDQRRESGDLSVLAYTPGTGTLAIRARTSWSKGTSLRLRSVVVADLDGDHRDEIVAGGQYDADGKVALALFAFTNGKLVLVDDASSTEPGVTGEIKDLVVAGSGRDARILATGVIGESPGRQGDVDAWRYAAGKLVRDRTIVSKNADETRTRALVVVPGTPSTVLTIGHAKAGGVMLGQILRWKL